MNRSLRQRALCLAAGAVLLSSAGPALSATEERVEPALMPSTQELARVSLSGNYLAARIATGQRDQRLAAAYLRAALRGDPRNGELIERTFIALVAAGQIEEAGRLAERLVQISKDHRLARLVIGIRAMKQRQQQLARTNLAQSIRGPVADLTAGVLTGWSHFAAGDQKAGLAELERLTGPEWFGVFRELHAGLMLDASGRSKEAIRRLERAYQLDQTALRVVEAYARGLARAGERERALEVLRAFDKVLPNHPLVVELTGAITADRPVEAMVRSGAAGSAELLYGLGASLARQGGEDLALIYLQLALHLDDDNPLALLALADLYEALKQPHHAIETYERVPEASPLRRNAEIQLGINLDSLDRTAEARKHLEALIAQRPDDIEALIALGNVLRARKNFAECADIYSRAVALVKEPTRSNWVLFYFRGICHERNKQWAKAEPDFQKALVLYPDQAHVLNYLGYSWIDQGVHLEAGMTMIRKAVEQRPDDGYIVDSLGWAYYRVGNYENAVKHLERAVELRPEDPVINDHLGDAYWKVGRKLEARFQWTHARDLKPEPDDLRKIEEKLRSGLADDPRPATATGTPPKPGGG